MNIADCTVTEKILLASLQLEQQGQSPFSAEALIVASWTKFPRTFGLKGYADQYPDSNKVLSSIMGERGLARKGWLAKMGAKLYSLSREGKAVAQRLIQGGEPAPVVESSKLTRDHEKFLQTLFAAQALEKFDEGRKPELTFSDACRFWNISENMHGEAIETRRGRFQSQLSEISRIVGTADAELSNGRSVSGDDISHLVDVDEYLRERFSRHLNLLRSRAEK